MTCQCGVFDGERAAGVDHEAHHVLLPSRCHIASLCAACPTCPFKPTPAGRKDDFGKTRYDLLPWAGLDLVAQVLTKGAEKYAPENWRKVEGWRWRYFRAAIGHIAKWWAGEKLDPEWGLPHLAHAACCVLFLLELDK